jgi:TRAP-type C4-dicarboxylate transport system permease small subunit
MTMSGFERFYRAYGSLLRAMGVVSSLATFAMMVLVVCNVASRYLLNRPITGTLEITESLLVVVIFLSVGITQYDGGHIRVNLLTRRMPPRLQHVANVVCMLCGAAFFSWCAYATWYFAVQSYSFDEHEWGSIVFPLYPVKFIIFAGMVMLAFQFLLDAVAEYKIPIEADHEHIPEAM